MVRPSHQDLAELVGATRPRVTEYLASFERKHLMVRDGRQLIVSRDRLESFLAQIHPSVNHRRSKDSRVSV
jgi:DNA-binding FadR family transcriptional regulator